MRYPDRPLDSIGGLVNSLRDDLDGYEGPVWYRGQSDLSWHLQPRLFREGGIDRENHLISRFKQHATLLLDSRPQTEFDWLFLMQHYGVPTRLLDWSENPLTGLYFSVCDASSTADAALWVLRPTDLNSKSHLKPAFEYEIPSFDNLEIVANYLPSTIARERVSLLNPIAAIASRNSLRMQAQQGVFTINHRGDVHVDDVGDAGGTRDYIWRYVVPSTAKEILRRDLYRVGFGKFQMFPELESIYHIIMR